MRRRNWELQEKEVTPESLFWKRRKFLRQAGFSVGSLLVLPGLLSAVESGVPSIPNPDFVNQYGGLTDEKLATHYNNFYEFTTDKYEVRFRANLGWKTEPWTLEVGGEVEKPLKLDVNKLVKEMAPEQRVYRFRCVEAWSMVIPWQGFPLSSLVNLVEPLHSAKFIQFETIFRPEEMPGQRRNVLPWPYVEGLRMDEANHPLTILATGMYGHSLLNQNGAPLRLVVPWKYGFKSIKSIVRIRFVENEPKATWSLVNPREYGFYSNVNPNVDHPRWTQAVSYTHLTLPTSDLV
mgnify:CR=1 FL=1